MAFQSTQNTKAPAPPPLWDRETQMAKSFVQQFYNTFDTNRAALASMYRDASQISFEGGTVQGANNFLQRLSQLGLPPGAQHRIVTVDAQPSVAGAGALLVFVTGEYVGQQYSEVFHIVDAAGMYVHNDIFRVGPTNPFNVPEAAKAVVKQFIEYYYSTFNTRRGDLGNLYRSQSCYTFEDSRLQGPGPILERLQQMPGLQHDSSSITADVQQVNQNQLLLVFVTGRLLLSDEANPLNFAETFQLVQEGQGYFVGNHMFKFKYG
jgi:hypothetical protein